MAGYFEQEKQQYQILLLNTPEDYPYRDIENWPHINGVFYAMEDQERVVNGLQGVLRGECYFTQKLASYLITHSGNYRYTARNQPSFLIGKKRS